MTYELESEIVQARHTLKELRDLMSKEDVNLRVAQDFQARCADIAERLQNMFPNRHPEVEVEVMERTIARANQEYPRLRRLYRWFYKPPEAWTAEAMRRARRPFAEHGRSWLPEAWPVEDGGADSPVPGVGRRSRSGKPGFFQRWLRGLPERYPFLATDAKGNVIEEKVKLDKGRIVDQQMPGGPTETLVVEVERVLDVDAVWEPDGDFVYQKIFRKVRVRKELESKAMKAYLERMRELDAEVRDLTAYLEKWGRDVDQIRETTAQLRAEATGVVNQVDGLRKPNDVAGELERKRTEIEGMREGLATRRKEIESATVKLKEMKQEIDDLWNEGGHESDPK